MGARSLRMLPQRTISSQITRPQSARLTAGLAGLLVLVSAVSFSPAAEEDASTLYTKALKALEEGRSSEAEQLSLRTVERDPSVAEAHALRAVVLEELGRGDEALESYREALRLKPDYAEVYHNLCLFHNQAQQFSEAVDMCRKAVEFNPRNGDALNNLGRAALKLGELDEAQDVLERALEIDPGSMSAHYNLALALAERGRVSLAIGELEIAYQGARETDDANRVNWIVEVCTRLLNRYPEDGASWRVHRLLGRIYSHRRWYGTAIPHLQIAAKHRDFDSVLQLGRCYRIKALTGEALSTLRRAVRMRPDDYQAHNEMGHALGTLQDDWKSAEHEFRAALDTRPDNPEVHYNLAYAMYRLGRYDLARESFEEAFRLKPEMAESEHYRGLEFPD